VCLCVWGTLYLVRFAKAAERGERERRGGRANLVLAAILPALGTYLRPDLYSFSLVLMLAAAWKSPGGASAKLAAAGRFAAATIATLVPLWVFQRATMGAPLGFHVETLFSSTSGFAKHVLVRPVLFYSLFVRSSSTVWASLVLSAPFLALFATNPRLAARTYTRVLALSGLAASAASIVIYRCFLGPEGPIACLGRSNSLFPAAPVLILGLVACRDSARSPFEEGARRLIWQIALGYAIVYGLAAPEMSKWGIHWGARYLVALYPLLAALAATSISDWWRLKARRRSQAPAGQGSGTKVQHAAAAIAVVALVVASLAAQILSLDILGRKMAYSLRLNHEVAGRPEQVVITDRWWLGQELYTQFASKMIFLATTSEQYRDLAARLAERGITRVIFAGPPVPGQPPEPGSVEVDDGGLGYWTLDLVPVDLGTPGR
jgi:hypothetical protein